MKYLAIAVILMFTACAIITKTEYTINDKVAVLAVGNDATDSMLTDISQTFKEKKGIEIDFSKSKFGEDNKIEYLNLKVKVGGSAGGVESATISTGEKRYGFKVDYTTKSGTTLMTGVIDDETLIGN